MQATEAPLGLRERKKIKTRQAIRRAAFRLIDENGYAATTVEQIAEAAEVSPSTFFRYFPSKESLLLADDLGTSILLHVGNEENVRAVMRHPAHLVGSDGLLVGERPHPRAYGAFARYLGHYVREEGLLSLEDCVAKMTGRAARSPMLVPAQASSSASSNWPGSTGTT